jgi:FkbM family methyltransferase
MKQVKGFWLPNREEHLVSFLEKGPEFAGGPCYQLHKLIACMPYIRNFRHAVDIGAHCGLWARPLSRMFGTVTAFEPVEAHRECLEENVAEYQIDNISIRPFALGNEEKPVRLHTGPSSSGDTFVSKDGEHEADMRTLDSFGLHDIDFIKIDCEGFERMVIAGGEQTIKRYRPTMIVEQKPNKGVNFGLTDTAAIDLLTSWGAKQVKVLSGDYILTW